MLLQIVGPVLQQVAKLVGYEVRWHSSSCSPGLLSPGGDSPGAAVRTLLPPVVQHHKCCR